MSYKTYEKYIDSNIEWIGDIPSHWEIIPVKHHFFSKKQIAGDLAEDYERLALTLNGVIKRSKYDSDGLQPEKFETYQIVRKNSLIFKLIDLENIKTSRVGLSKYEGLVSPAYILLISNGDIMPEYAEKYFLSMWHGHIFNHLGSVGVRSNLNREDVLNLPIIKPPLYEQKQISKYLDEKINEIDSIISKNEQLIELLKEKKLALINQVVAKGLNIYVPMKDSGIEWIGNMPTHWSLTKLKYISTRVSKRARKQDEMLVCSNSGKVILKKDSKSGLVTEKEEKLQKVEKGDLLIHGMDTWHGAIAISNYDGKCTPVVHVCKSNEDKRYLKYYLQSLAFKNVYKAISNGIRENTSDFRSWEKAGSIPLSLPPLNEQNQISNYLDNEIYKMEIITQKMIETIELLKEYKTSLIRHVATGKIDVRGE